jgi:hypothetical protein
MNATPESSSPGEGRSPISPRKAAELIIRAMEQNAYHDERPRRLPNEQASPGWRWPILA